VLDITSSEIIAWILFGMSEFDENRVGDAVSYALAAAATVDDMERGHSPPPIAPALDRLLPWVGEVLASHRLEFLAENGDSAVVLIGCGPLSGIPLAAAPASDAGGCLLDSVRVSTTPSATAHAAALRRTATRLDVFETLVAVADPTGDLSFTRTEVKQVGALFSESEVALGEDATRDWLSSRIGKASGLHLACHGHGGLLDSRRNGLLLADGMLSGPEIATLGPIRARLAVASACQTAVVGVGDGGEEAFSVGAALLAAGASCVFASLWPVNDLATAMLMTHAYEQLKHGSTPVAALQHAQRWLRDITIGDARSFIDRHPTLRQIPFARSRSVQKSDDELHRPFSHPEFWAGFVALGA